MSFGDFLSAVITVGAGVLLGPVGGAVVGGLTGALKEGKSGALKGAAIGSLSGVIASSFSESGLFQGSADATNLGTPGASETLTSGGAGSNTAIGAPEATSATQELAQGTLAGETAAPSTAGAAQSAAPIAPGGAMDMMGSAGTGLEKPAPGLIDSALKFTKDNPLASVLGLQAVGGIGKSIADDRMMREKILADQELQQRMIASQHYLNPSAGGVGVNINLRPGDPVLRRPDGTPVFQQGIIASRMTR